jgi:hypothetical protein
VWRTLLAAVVLVAAVGAGVVAAPDDVTAARPALATALDSLPAATLTASFTDWSAVRDQVGDDLDAAREQDLAAGSVLAASADVMDDSFGFSVRDARWEVLGQAREGAVVVLRLADGVDLAGVTTRLESLGYARPDESDGVWVGGVDLVAGIEARLTPLLAHVAVIADRHLLVMSDSRGYAEQVADVVTSGDASMVDDDALADVATPLLGDLVAVVHRGERACAVPSYASTSELDRRDARAARRAAGPLLPHRALGFGIASADAGLRLDVSMRFDDPAVAARQRDVRTRLAEGPAIGQGGTYAERFAVTVSAVSDGVVTLGLTPREEPMTLLSDLSAGPLMFAWCGG